MPAIDQEQQVGSRDGDDSDRHASWLELFFDLVYVLAVAELALGLRKHADLEGFGTFIALFLPIWWAWSGFTFFSSRFDHDDVGHRLLMLAAMFASLVLAVAVGGAFGQHTTAFALPYAAVRTILVLMYVRAGLRDRRVRGLTDFYAIWFGLAAGMWAASTLLPAPARYVVWGLAFAIEVGAPIAAKDRLGTNPIDITHLPERFGLFVLIVLGESVVTVGSNVATATRTSTLALAAAIAFVLVAAVWWSYFDVAVAFISRQVANHPNTGTRARDIYSYGHFPVVAGLTALAAGVEIAIVESGHAHLTPGPRWVLAAGACMYLLALSGINGVLVKRGGNYLIWFRVTVSGVICALAAFGGGFTPVLFLLSMTVALVAVALFGAIRVRRTGMDLEKV